MIEKITCVSAQEFINCIHVFPGPAAHRYLSCQMHGNAGRTDEREHIMHGAVLR